LAQGTVLKKKIKYRTSFSQTLLVSDSCRIYQSLGKWSSWRRGKGGRKRKEKENKIFLIH
jgi:hypothetical protein